MLSTAVKMSPKAILRQQELGEIAMENKDFSTAEMAFSQAVNLGKHSIHKHPKIYAGLAESTVSNEDNKNKQSAFKVIEQMQRDFKGNREADLYAAIAATVVHLALGEEEKSACEHDRRRTSVRSNRTHVNPELTLSMAKIYAKLGHDEKSKSLFQNVIKNNHDDDEFLRRVEAALIETGMSETASSMISETREGDHRAQ